MKKLFPSLLLLAFTAVVFHCTHEKRIPITPNVEVIPLETPEGSSEKQYKIIAIGKASKSAIEKNMISMKMATSCQAAKIMATSKAVEITGKNPLPNQLLQPQEEELLDSGKFCKQTYLLTKPGS